MEARQERYGPYGRLLSDHDQAHCISFEAVWSISRSIINSIAAIQIDQLFACHLTPIASLSSSERALRSGRP